MLLPPTFAVRQLSCGLSPRVFLQYLVVAALIVGSLALQVDAVLPPCRCHNGIVMSENESCVCQCVAGYLLPRCLYRADDVVEVKALWFGPATADDQVGRVTVEEPGSSAGRHAATRRCAAWPSWYDEAALERDWQATFVPADGESGSLTVVGSRCVSSGWAVQRGSGDGANAALAAVMETTIALSGWMAQRILWQAAWNDTGALVPSAFGGAEVQLADVRDMARGPPTAPRYVDEWLRITVATTGRNSTASSSFATSASRYWFLSLRECGWVVTALLVALVLGLVEYVWMFNTARNVGGGVQRTALSAAPDGAASQPRTHAQVPRPRAAQPASAHRPPVSSTARGDDKGTREDAPRGDYALANMHLRKRMKTPESTSGTEGSDPTSSRPPLSARFPNPLTAARSSPARTGTPLQ